ncbi:MAG: superoxide dismutase family protein [Sphingomonas sp.]
MRIGQIGIALAAITLANCAGDQAGRALAARGSATATLADANGKIVGTATATSVKEGLRVTMSASQLSQGQHGVHIHAVGQCDAPGFMTAGGHWNPTGAKHGAHNPAGPHEGDLPNMIVGKDGRGSLGVVIPGGTIEGLLDADGATLVIHAAADDLVTDPSGNSGARVACGVFGRN